MGKQTKYDKLGVMGKREADKRMAEQYGIDLSQYGNTGRPGQNYTNKKSYDDLKKDVATAAANDYDVRRSIEAAQASGNKKAQKIGSISNASEAYDATRFMEKTHKNRMGNTGSYDGANDQGNVTNYWTEKQASKYATKSDLDDMSVDSQIKDAKKVTEPEYSESSHLSDAKERVMNFQASAAGNNDEQRNKAASSFAKYKLNLT